MILELFSSHSLCASVPPWPRILFFNTLLERDSEEEARDEKTEAVAERPGGDTGNAFAVGNSCAPNARFGAEPRGKKRERREAIVRILRETTNPTSTMFIGLPRT